MTEKSIAHKLKNLRLKLNMSQERFGKKLGLTGKTISAYECGRSVPPLKILEKVSKYYGAEFMTIADERRIELTQKIALMKTVLLEIEDQLK
jgi:transcriptional regulator with XRE-family HTH domain